MTKPHADIPLTEIEEVLPILNRIALFGGLNELQLFTVFRLLRRTHYDTGEFIFETGDEPRDIYIVFCGSVELMLNIEGGYLAEAVFEVGDCFGETAVIGIQRHVATAVAREPTELIVLPRAALFGLWDTDKELFAMLVLNIAREACRRLNRADQTLLQYYAKASADQRRKPGT